MKKEILLHLFLGLFTCIFQVAFVRNLLPPLDALNIVTIAIVYVLVIKNYKFALFWTILTGLTLDIIHFTPFGIYTAISLTSFILLDILYTNYFTDNSLYSVSVLFAAFMLTQESIFAIINNTLSTLGFINYSKISINTFLTNEISNLFLNLVLIAISFYFISFFSSNLTTTFLKSSKKQLQ